MKRKKRTKYIKNCHTYTTRNKQTIPSTILTKSYQKFRFVQYMKQIKPKIYLKQKAKMLIQCAPMQFINTHVTPVKRCISEPLNDILEPDKMSILRERRKSEIGYHEHPPKRNNFTILGSFKYPFIAESLFICSENINNMLNNQLRSRKITLFEHGNNLALLRNRATQQH